MSSISYIPNLSGLAYQKYQLRSSALSIRSLRSAKSLKSLNSTINFNNNEPYFWKRRPLLIDALYTSLQKASYHVAIFIMIETCIQILISMFNIYCLILSSKGSKHFKQLGISFIFVYSGNNLVRWSLILCSFILLICSIFLFASSIILIKALKKENELRFLYFIRSLFVFMILRFLITIYELIINDLFFLYHQLNFIFWFLISFINLFAFLIVLSNYQELRDLTKLTDLTKDKIAASMNVSRSIHDTSHLNALNTISSKFNNLSISTTPSQSVCGSTISESFEKAYKEQEKQLILQQQQMQQSKLNQAFNQLKNSQCPLASPSLL